MIENLKVIYPFFLHSFFMQCVSIVFKHVLTSIIKRKFALAGDVCSRPPISIRFHDLQLGNIRKIVGEITSYHEKD
jgi:hypothetical protein